MLATLNLSLLAGCVAERRQDNAVQRTPDPQAPQQESRAQSRPRNIRLVTREVRLGKVPLTAQLTNLVVCADNRHMAYPVIRAGGWTVSLDGVEGAKFTRVDNLTLSPDGQRLAYAGIRGGRALVVVDGKEGPGFDYVEDEWGPVFSPNSQRLAYSALGHRKAFVVVGGQEGKEYASWMGQPCFEGSKLVRVVAVGQDELFNYEALRVEVEIVDEK